MEFELFCGAVERVMAALDFLILNLIFRFLVPDIEKYWRHALSDLVELDPTNVELNFMLIQLCLNSAGQKYQGHVLEATEKILQIQSDNMHEYYTKKLKLVNYSGRLARLMKINRAIEADVRDRKEKNHIAKVFDLFFVEYSHPEMFEFSWYGFFNKVFNNLKDIPIPFLPEKRGLKFLSSNFSNEIKNRD